MSRIFFTSDTHFGHSGILNYCRDTRPFENIREHDQALVENWNAVVQPGDVVYHLGDVAWVSDEMNKTLRRLNGYKVLIPGNHDDRALRDKSFCRQWDDIIPGPYHEMKVQDAKLVLCHYPIWEWNGMFSGAWHLHGHVHGKPTHIPGKILDVGVDTNQLFPYSMDQVIEKMATKEIALSQPRKSL